MEDYLILKANVSDHLKLTEITKKSKAFWGYSKEQLLLWDEDLTISRTYIDKSEVYLLIHNSRIIAYYSYFLLEEKYGHLDNLFVLPEYMKRGIGKILMQHFESEVTKSGCNKVTLDADPHAESFYLKSGYKIIGKKPSSIEGRYLPLMEKRFNN